jgi:ABC-type branched-subunit amino acid transport system substrate-binding protein
LLSCAVTLALLTTACGARWTDEQEASIAARYAGESATSGSAGTTATTIGGASTGAAGSSGNPAAGAAGGAQPGDLGGDVGSAGAGDPATARPCAAPTDAPGVTDTELTVGSISSLSGPVPGFGTTSHAATQAYVEYRNAKGGVCGRKIVMRTGDDGTDVGRHRALMTELGPHVLGIVGGQAGGDAGSAEVVETQGIPVVTAAISKEYAQASTVFTDFPPPADLNAVIGKYRFLHEQGVRDAAILYVAVDAGRYEATQQQRPLIEAAGINIVLEQAVPLSTLSYDSAARAVANSGADFMYFVHSADASAAMARAMRDTGYDLMFADYTTAYGSEFIDLAGEAAEGSTSWIRTLPIEDGGAVAEQATYLEWMSQTAPGINSDIFATLGWAAAKAFFDSLEALPSPITRQGLIDQLRATSSYDAGGMLGTIDFGREVNLGCQVAMVARGGEWVRLVPSAGFLC